MSDPESNGFSIIKWNLRNYKKIIKSLIEKPKNIITNLVFKFLKIISDNLVNIRNTKKHLDIPKLFTWNNKTFKDKTEITNQINPLTAGAEYIRVLIFLLPHSAPPFKHVKDKMWHQPARFEKGSPLFFQIWIIFTHLKLWIASARNNFKWVKIQIE